MRKSIRRSKRRVGFGFISENIMNMLKKAAGPVAKAVSKTVGSKIGNIMANKIFPSTTRDYYVLWGCEDSPLFPVFPLPLANTNLI